MMMRIMGHDCVGVWGREQLKGRGKGYWAVKRFEVAAYMHMKTA
jgi:hypothetical protein